MNYKLFTLFFISIFLLSSISALDFDNLKTYNEKTKTATIENSIGAFGIGIPTSKVADITLTTKQVENLEVGYRQVAGQNFIPFEDPTPYLIQENFKLIDLNYELSEKIIYRQLDFKYKVYVEKEVNDYREYCFFTGKKTNYGIPEQKCEKEITGSHKELVAEWKPLSEYIYKEGVPVEIGIFTEVKYGDNVEWIPTYYGKEIPEWASWTSNLNTNIKAYHKLDEASGSVIDSINGNSGTNNGATPNVAGIINSAYDFESTENDYVSIPAGYVDFVTPDFTVNAWIKPESTTGNKLVFGSSVSGGYIFGSSVGGVAKLWGGRYGDTSCDSVTATNINVGGWHMVTYKWNSSGITYYVNGTKKDTIACSFSMTAGNPYYIGAYVGPADTFDGIIDEVGVWNRSLTEAEITDLWNSGLGITYSTPPTVTQVSPANTTNSSISSVTITWTVTDAIKVSNTTLFIDGVANYTNTSGVNGSYSVTQNYADGNHNWSIGAMNNQSQSSNSSNWTFNVSSSVSSTLNLPLNATSTNLTSITLNSTGTAGAGTLTNATTYVWYSNGTSFNTTTETKTGTTNQTNITINNLPINSFKWNTQYCQTNGQCAFATNNYTFTVGSIKGTPLFNTTTYETLTQNISMNITSYNSTTPTNAVLTYNGTNYTATISSVGNGNYTLSRSLTSPVTGSNTSISFSFTWNSSGTWESSSSQTQYINQTTLSYCGGSSSNKYLNLTFLDETNSSSLNGIIASSTFNYYAGTDSTVYKTLTYSNSTGANNVTFCSNTPFLPYNVDYNVSYSATGYPQRSFDSSIQIIKNTTTNQTLYLLSSADGQYVTFQVINIAEQALEGVQSNASTSISGTQVIVGSGTTGADGGITFWLNPNTAHTFNFSKTGYAFYSTTITPTQSGYTITLTSTSSANVTDSTRGIDYTIRPTIGTTLTNGTQTNFNFTMNSSYWVLDSFSFYLQGNNGTIINSSSSTASIGTINVYSNTSNYTSITMFYSWVINGTASNLSVSWYVYDSTGGNGWSILTFFTDLSSYSNQGLFGLSAENLSFLVFLIIFISTGLVSYKFSITSPAVVSGIVFVLVFIFDVALGMIQNPVNAITHFPTILFLIIMAGFIVKEVTT